MLRNRTSTGQNKKILFCERKSRKQQEVEYEEKEMAENSILAVAAGAVLAVVTRNSKKKYNKVK